MVALATAGPLAASSGQGAFFELDPGEIIVRVRLRICPDLETQPMPATMALLTADPVRWAAMQAIGASWDGRREMTEMRVPCAQAKKRVVAAADHDSSIWGLTALPCVAFAPGGTGGAHPAPSGVGVAGGQPFQVRSLVGAGGQPVFGSVVAEAGPGNFPEPARIGPAAPATRPTAHHSSGKPGARP